LSSRLFTNSGTGTFSDAGVELPLLLGGAVAWGDGDADGDLDLLVTGGEIGPFLLDGKVAVFENSGGTFSDAGVEILGRFGEPGTGRYGGDAAWGDFNHDGLMDFLVSGHASTVSAETGRTYESLGNLQFSYSTVGFRNGAFASGANGATVWGDLEGDGDIDLLTSAHDPAGNPISRLYLNHLTEYPRNTEPDPPEILGADVDGSTVTLSWGAGHDEQTPTPALTYNVRIGRVSGANNMMPAMSGPDGTRRLPASGNAGHNLTWSVRNLDSGTYFWSVQTIDTSFLGSPFAEEGQFTIQ
jgi:hypothetical protein